MKKNVKFGNIVTVTAMIVAVITLTFSAVLYVLSANQQRTNASLTVNYVATNVYVEVDATYQKKLDATPTALTGGPLTFQPTSLSTTGTLSAGDIVLSPNDNYVLFTYSFKNMATSGAYDIMVSMSDTVSKANTNVYYAYNSTLTAMSTMATSMTSTRTTTAPQNISIPAQQKWYMYVYVEISDPYFGASYTSDASHFISFNIHNTMYTGGFPDEYQQLEYIESGGNCVIDTGLLPTTTMVSQVKFMTNSSRYFSYGTRESADKSSAYYEGINYRFFQYNNQWLVDMGNGTPNGTNNRLTVSSPQVQANTIYELELGNRYLKDISNGSSLASSSAISGFSYEEPFTIKVFSVYTDVDSSSTIGERLYYIKIYDNGTLVRSFVPCYRRADGEVGLYDTVNGVFYENQGSGTFKKGPGIGVPDAYTEVEYIESTGEQYIDTGYKPNGNTMVKLKGRVTEFLTTDNALFEVRINSGGENRFGYFLTYANDNLYNTIDYYTSYKISQQLGSEMFELSLSNDLYVNGSLQHSLSITTFTSDYNLYIFCGNYSNTASWFSKYKLYQFEIYDAGTLVRSFIPCYRNSDGEVGLYDTVNGVFYENQGSGDFVKGPCLNLPTTYTQVDYIESTGEQYIDTGVVPTTTSAISLDFQITAETFTDTTYFMFGQRGTSTPTTIQGGYNASNLWAMFNNYDNGTNAISVSPNKLRHVMQLSNDGQYLDGVLSGTQSITRDCMDTLYLFGRQIGSNGAIYQCAVMRLFSMQIYNGSSLVRNYVPCYRNDDNEVGLFDMVTGEFYTNSGTGNFLLPS